MNLMKLLTDLEEALPDLKAAAESGYDAGIDSEGGEGELPPLPEGELPPLPEEGGEGEEPMPEDMETPPPFPGKKKKPLPF